MAENNRPRGRKRNVTGQGTGVHVGNNGLGTGPVGGRGDSIGGSSGGSSGSSGGGGSHGF